VRQQQINDALPTETLGGHDQLKRGKTEIYWGDEHFFPNFSCPVDSRRYPKDGSNLKYIDAAMKIIDMLPKI
jgi:hypothetical protein